jgi:hypothetical protein
MRLSRLKRWFVGTPIATAQAEEILRVLLLAGAGALAFSVPIGLLIGAVIGIEILSYRQKVVGAALIIHFVTINRRYNEVARQLSLDGYAGPPPMQHTVLVLVGDLHKGVVQALQYAQTLSPSAKAVYVELDPEKTPPTRGEVGQVGLRGAARGADLTLSPAAGTTARVRGPSAGARR